MKQVDAKSVLLFESLQRFLFSHYEYRKGRNSKFSYESWARQLNGLNRSLLSQIASGKRNLPAVHVDSFLRYFRFNPDEKRHFMDLVTLGGKEGHKKELRRKVLERVQYHQDLHIVKEVEQFLETPEIPVLATLFTFKDVPKDLASLCEIMDVDLHTLQNWLKVMESLGFIKMTTGGHWKNTKNSFRVPSQLGRGSLIKFHRLSLMKALAGLDAPKEQRHYEALLIAMSPEEYQQYLAMLDEFRLDVLGRFNADTFANRNLYQVNFAVCPSLTSL